MEIFKSYLRIITIHVLVFYCFYKDHQLFFSRHVSSLEDKALLKLGPPVRKKAKIKAIDLLPLLPIYRTNTPIPFESRFYCLYFIDVIC